MRCCDCGKTSRITVASGSFSSSTTMPQTDPGNFCWLIYPEYERKLLPDLAAYLDRYDAQGIFSFLLDMYGPGTIAEAVATPRRSPLDAILTVSISGAAGCAFLAYSAALPRIQRHRRPEMAPVFCVLASILLSAADHLAHE
jgi:hypothetical protein